MQIPSLVTSRLRLLPPGLGSEELYRRFYTDATASKSYGGPLTPGGAWNRLASDVGAWHLQGFGVWVIQEMEGASLIGTCGFWQVRPNPSLKRSANGRPPGPVWRYAVHFRQPGPGVLPCRPLSSYYKGFPICQAIVQAMPNCEAIQHGTFGRSDPRSGVGTAEAASRKRTGRTTNGHRCSFSAADPDARRARGPHSLVEDDGGRLHELNRHTPYRSNLDASTLAVTRRWKKVLWAPLVGTARWMVRRAQAGRTKSSPRRSTAQAMRAFFAAMATTARQ
jgi:hypothetical protein